MNTREVQNLPLVSRNPHNFALLQANVTGRPSRGAAVFPTVNANGYARRVNYQLDGNTNTQADRAGVRLMNISETFVDEVQLVTNGFAAEFGNTPGLIMNVVTPSGTNALHGSVSYRLRRPSFYSRPFSDLPASIFPAAIPTLEGGPFYIFRTDAQLNKSNRLTGRFNHSDQSSQNFIEGRLNTLERTVTTTSVDYSLGVQLVSFTPKVLNEFRFKMSGAR